MGECYFARPCIAIPDGGRWFEGAVYNKIAPSNSEGLLNVDDAASRNDVPGPIRNDDLDRPDPYDRDRGHDHP